MEHTVPRDVHHSVAHSRTEENTHGSHRKNGPEGSDLRSDCRLKEIHRIVADADHKVKDCQDKQKYHKSQIN